ncbi:MAG: S8 family serine peptidase [Acidobacteriota bacterium]
MPNDENNRESKKIGQLLGQLLGTLDAQSTPALRVAVASQRAGSADGERLPVVLKLGTRAPEPDEPWGAYKARIDAHLGPTRERIAGMMGLEVTPLVAANALAVEADPDQIQRLLEEQPIEKIELDPLVRLTAMDDAVIDVSLAAYQARQPGLTGRGVRVAVIDSGVDAEHPALEVAEAVSTCDEPNTLPGSHGTHCAGSIASRDAHFPGIAPEVTLIDVKVLNADGSGRHTYIVRGIDEALERGAHILSISVGFNQLPRWSQGGHGWYCDDGDCPLCVAIDNAVAFDNVLAVVAAGNEHRRAETLRNFGEAATVTTEITCPGHARRALTVGALTKRTFLPADFSSRGPTRYGVIKPDLVAPGVNITSTVPVPRGVDGRPIQHPPRARLFDRKSGTSMATPIVAGAAALVVQQMRDAGRAWTPADVIDALQTRGLAPIVALPNVVGQGRLDLRTLDAFPPDADETNGDGTLDGGAPDDDASNGGGPTGARAVDCTDDGPRAPALKPHGDALADAAFGGDEP